MCGLEARIRSRTSCIKPVISASAMTSAMTPTVTPSVEMNEITEMNACLRLATRYRKATCSSKGTFTLFPLTHQRKQNYIPDRRAVRQQHDEAIDPDALAGGRRQTVLERADVVFVHRVRFEVAPGAAAQLGFETP